MDSEDVMVARHLMTNGRVNTDQLKDALYEQVFDVSVTGGRHGSRPLLRVLLDQGVISGDTARNVEAHISAPSVPNPAATVGQTHSPPEVAEAQKDGGNCYGTIVRVECLGKGGMGEVWRAWDTKLRRWVAAKFFDASWRHPLQEARIAARLTHPNIVPIYSIVDEDGVSPYLVMKYCDGGTLHDRKGSIDAWQAAEILLPIVRAVAFAHENRIIHRDIKPSNILLEKGGTPFLTDFGLARNIAEGSASQTRVEGTPLYMAPEQLQGTIGPSVDVYALGATLYELVTGRAAYSGTSFRTVAMAILRADPPVPRSIRPDVPEDLERIILRAMSRDLEHRYATASAMAADLDRFLQGGPVVGEGEATFSEAYALLVEGRLKAGIGRLREAFRLPWAVGSPANGADAIVRQLDDNEASVTEALARSPGSPSPLEHRAGVRLVRCVVLAMLGEPTGTALIGAWEDLNGLLAASPRDAALRLRRAILALLSVRVGAVEEDPALDSALGDLDASILEAPTAGALQLRAMVEGLRARRARTDEDARLHRQAAVLDLERAVADAPTDAELARDLAHARHRSQQGPVRPTGASWMKPGGRTLRRLEEDAADPPAQPAVAVRADSRPGGPVDSLWAVFGSRSSLDPSGHEPGPPAPRFDSWFVSALLWLIPFLAGVIVGMYLRRPLP